MISITLYCSGNISICRLMLDDGMPIVVYLNNQVIRIVTDTDACDLDELISYAERHAESQMG